jgi:hypothetical protein
MKIDPKTIALEEVELQTGCIRHYVDTQYTVGLKNAIAKIRIALDALEATLK